MKNFMNSSAFKWIALGTGLVVGYFIIQKMRNSGGLFTPGPTFPATMQTKQVKQTKGQQLVDQLRQQAGMSGGKPSWDDAGGMSGFDAFESLACGDQPCAACAAKNSNSMGAF